MLDRSVTRSLGMTRRSKILLAIGAAFLGFVAVLPWLIPTSTWIAPVQDAASKALGAKVVIGKLAVVILPLPHATATDIDVGDGALHVRTVRVYPQVMSLLSSTPHLRSVEVSDVALLPAGVDLLAAFAARPSIPAVTIGRLRVKAVAVTLAAGALPPLDADVELGAANAPIEALLATADGKAKVRAVPDGDGWTLDVQAADWQLPMGPPLKFAELKARGRADRGKVVFSDFSARLYGGQVTGSAELDYAKGFKVAGKAAVSQLDIAPMLQVLGMKAALTGRVDASGPFHARAATSAGLADAFHADVAFKVHDGVLHGFDLASAAKNLLRSGASGGQTRFDALTGNAQVAGKAVRLRNVKVGSGVLDAKGNVDVSAARQLSGRVEVEIKGTGGLVGVPLAVSGTVASPILLPTRGALAGAAIGTVLLPGVGTSVGSSIGDKLGKMFGK